MKLFEVDNYKIRKDNDNNIAVWIEIQDESYKLVYSTSTNVGNINELPNKVRDAVLKEKIWSIMKKIYEDKSHKYFIYKVGNTLMCSIRKSENRNFVTNQFNVYKNKDEFNNLPDKVKDIILEEVMWMSQNSSSFDFLDKTEEDNKNMSLTDKFIVPPFSVLDARQGYWQKRKKEWRNIGIRSEIGRSGNVFNTGAKAGNGKMIDQLEENNSKKKENGRSIFDPVLTEIIYKWFNVDNGKILDPFAGGSVRGVVAKELNYQYKGIELREEQVKANRVNRQEIFEDSKNLTWKSGDSEKALEKEKDNHYDLLFTCPPYYNLEVYSERKGELSAFKNYNTFLDKYRKIIKKSLNKIKKNRFACVVVSDIRNENGFYRDLPGDTIDIFTNNGAKLYNRAILLNELGTVPMRTSYQFPIMHKLGKTHENVLIFYKGNQDKIKENYNLDTTKIKDSIDNTVR